MTVQCALPNKHYSGYHQRATEIEGEQKYLKKRSEETNGYGRFQIQLEEDGGIYTGQSWMETPGVAFSHVTEAEVLLTHLSHCRTMVKGSDWRLRGPCQTPLCHNNPG